jgi:glutaredoxin 3
MDKAKGSSKVIVYSAAWCAFCHAAKQYFDKLGVPYDDRDVEHDMKHAHEAVTKSNQMGIPVIDIDDTIIIGFDRPRIDAALKEKGLVRS